MPTIVTIIGETNVKSNLKPIEFCRAWVHPDIAQKTETNPSLYDFVELIAKDYFKDYDLMFAYDKNDRAGGTVFIGHFNDGVVE